MNIPDFVELEMRMAQLMTDQQFVSQTDTKISKQQFVGNCKISPKNTENWFYLE